MINKVQKNKSAFSLLEIMLAMTIFAVLGMALFQMFGLLTSVQTASLGAQHFKLKAHSILERLETELSSAVIGTYNLYKTGVTIKNEGDFSTTTKKIPYEMEFHCIPGTGGGLHFKTGIDYNDSKNGVQQIHFVSQKYYTPSTGEIDNFIEKMDNRFFFNQVILQEKVLYLDNKDPLYVNPITNLKDDTQNLNLYVRNEEYTDKDEDGNPNKNMVDGIAKTAETGKAMEINSDIKSIQYLFWGNNSKDWNDDGSGAGSPILTWDSTNSSNLNIHGIGELPHAVKIILTLVYNPEQEHKRDANLDVNKSNDLIFERIISFNYRGNA